MVNTNIGINLTLKDMFSSPLRELNSKSKVAFGNMEVGVKKVGLSFKSFFTDIKNGSLSMANGIASSSKSIDESLMRVTARSSVLKKEIKDIEKEFSNLERQKLNLEQEFKSGKISAEQYKNSLKEIAEKQHMLSNKKLYFSSELKSATTQAHNLNSELNRTSNIISNTKSFFGNNSGKMLGVGASSVGVSGLVGKRTMIDFMEAETANARLENTLMNKSGKIEKYHKPILDKAKQLGADLTGTTADFINMAAIMRGNNVSSKTILNGGLESTAKMAILTRMNYEEAAVRGSKIKSTMNLSDKDYIHLTNDLQKMTYMGADPCDKKSLNLMSVKHR